MTAALTAGSLGRLLQSLQNTCQSQSCTESEHKVQKPAVRFVVAQHDEGLREEPESADLLHTSVYFSISAAISYHDVSDRSSLEVLANCK